MLHFLHTNGAACAALFAAFSALGACLPASAADNPVVIELFTSQGCSSCPPADALLSKLAREPGVTALSFPVDYWDYIGWKDTFASPTNTARQKAYAAARGDNHVYTPQAVVNGLMHAVGSDALEVATARQLAYGDKGALKVSLSVTDSGDKLVARAGAAVEGAGKWGSLWLVPVAKSRSVAIGRGENNGRSVTYTNVVRGMKKIGDWSGAATSFDITKSDLKTRDSDAWVLMLQSSSGGKPGAVLAVAKSDGL